MTKEKEEKVMDLSYFMPSKVEIMEETKAIISTRFKDENGKPIPFIFKPISTKRVDQLEELHRKPVMRNGRKVGEEVDYSRFIAHVAVESTVYPNFRAPELRKAYKSEDPIEIAKKVLNIAGEYANWIAKASQVNGFDEDIEELEEEVKNS